MTVKELMRLLAKEPQDAQVMAEGCCGGGCWVTINAAVTGSEVVLIDKNRTVLLPRASRV